MRLWIYYRAKQKAYFFDWRLSVTYLFPLGGWTDTIAPVQERDDHVNTSFCELCACVSSISTRVSRISTTKFSISSFHNFRYHSTVTTQLKWFCIREYLTREISRYIPMRLSLKRRFVREYTARRKFNKHTISCLYKKIDQQTRLAAKSEFSRQTGRGYFSSTNTAFLTSFRTRQRRDIFWEALCSVLF